MKILSQIDTRVGPDIRHVDLNFYIKEQKSLNTHRPKHDFLDSWYNSNTLIAIHTYYRLTNVHTYSLRVIRTEPNCRVIKNAFKKSI